MLLCTGGISAELQNPSTFPRAARLPQRGRRSVHICLEMHILRAALTHTFKRPRVPWFFILPASSHIVNSCPYCICLLFKANLGRVKNCWIKMWWVMFFTVHIFGPLQREQIVQTKSGSVVKKKKKTLILNKAHPFWLRCFVPQPVSKKMQTAAEKEFKPFGCRSAMSHSVGQSRLPAA